MTDVIVGLIGLGAVLFSIPYGYYSLRVKRLQVEYLELQCEKIDSELNGPR